MNKSETIAKLAEALSKAQGEMLPASREAENPFFHSHYSTLSGVWDACRGPLAKHGLSVSQLTDFEEGKLIIETVLLHSSGEWISGRLTMVITKNDPQSLGSLISYGRRYSLAGCVGVTSADDDAEGAMDREGKKESPKKEEIPEFSFNDPLPPEGSPSLTFDELREKLLAVTAVPHLKNVWTKYTKEIRLLDTEQQNRLTAIKDEQKKRLALGGTDGKLPSLDGGAVT